MAILRIVFHQILKVAALAWLYDQPSLEPRADHLFDVISGAVLTVPAGAHQEQTPAQR